MIDPLALWQSDWAALPKVADDSWKSNLANYLAAKLDSKIQLATYTPPSGVSFTFNKAAFISGLSGVSAGTGDGVAKIASAFASAVTASGALVVAPGTAIGSPSPATIFSVVTSSVFSTGAASAKIGELATAPPVSDPLQSAFPIKLREATLLLTATVSGLNSVTPTPAPLVDSNRAVL